MEILLILCWVFTVLFIISVTIALELFIYQFVKGKWHHAIPIMAGVVMAGPAMYLAKGFGMTLPGGMPFVWVVFLIALLMSCLGTWIGACIWRKTEDESLNNERNE